jgi:hypothetical protein
MKPIGNSFELMTNLHHVNSRLAEVESLDLQNQQLRKSNKWLKVLAAATIGVLLIGALKFHSDQKRDQIGGLV